ncbi:hypothetical protein GCM10023238_27760 [Streptomyces heliomycini]
MVVTASGCVMYGSPLLRFLAAVPAFGDLVGALDLAERGVLDLGVVAADDPQQRLEDRVVRVRALHAEPGEAGADAVGGAGARLAGVGAGRGRGALGRGRLGARLLGLVGRRGLGVLDRPTRVVLRVGRARRGLGRGRRGGLGLGGGQVLGLVWQEGSSCAIRVPGQAPETPW